MFNPSNSNIFVPDRVRDVKLSPIGPMYRYQLNVSETSTCKYITDEGSR